MKKTIGTLLLAMLLLSSLALANTYEPKRQDKMTVEWDSHTNVQLTPGDNHPVIKMFHWYDMFSTFSMNDGGTYAETIWIKNLDNVRSTLQKNYYTYSGFTVLTDAQPTATQYTYRTNNQTKNAEVVKIVNEKPVKVRVSYGEKANTVYDDEVSTYYIVKKHPDVSGKFYQKTSNDKDTATISGNIE